MTTKSTAYDMSKSVKNPEFALSQFTSDECSTHWKGIETLLDAVPDTWRYWTKEYIQTGIASGNIQVWGLGPPPYAVMVFFTQVAVYPAMKVLSMVWGAGSFDDRMLPLVVSTMENYAKLNGCKSIEMRGRRGWRRAMRKIDAKEECVTWSIPVPDVRIN